MSQRISCDWCGADLTETGPMPAWRIRLDVRPIPHVGNTVYSIALSPPAESGDFCSVSHLLNHLHGDPKDVPDDV